MGARPSSNEWAGWAVVAIVIVAGVAGGFAVGLLYPSGGGRDQKAVRVDTQLRFDAGGSGVRSLQQGWDKPRSWGTWMKGTKSSILLGFDGSAAGDVDLLVVARTGAATERAAATVIVRYNDNELARWALPPASSDVHRHFTVPKAVFNGSSAGRIEFEITAAEDGPPRFGLQSVALQDGSLLAGFNGRLDLCRADKLVGWAVANGAAADVSAVLGGRRLKATFTNKERPDIGVHGFPVDAGFELTVAEPVPSGSRIEVRFASGRELSGSPCKI